MNDLCIRRMENRYRLAADTKNPARIGKTLDTLTVKQLPALMERSLDRVLKDSGLTVDCRLAIRRMDLRVGVDTREVDEWTQQLAENWAEAFATSLQKMLADNSIDGRAPVVTDDFAFFPNPMLAEVYFIVLSAQGSANPWWSQAILAKNGRVPSTVEMMARWIRRHPPKAARMIAKTARASGDDFGRLISDDQGQGLVDSLFQSAFTGESLEKDPLADREKSTREGSVELVNLLSGEARSCLYHAPTVGVRRLIALVFLMERNSHLRITPAQLALVVNTVCDAPTLSSPLDITTHNKESDAGIHDTQTRSDDSPSSAQKQATPAARKESADFEMNISPDLAHRLSDQPIAPEQVEGADVEARLPGLPVGCGGLLFLIRPVLRMLEDLPLDELKTQMLLVGHLALHHVLAPLPDGLRRAAYSREQPLLEVFAGTETSTQNLDAGPPRKQQDQKPPEKSWSVSNRGLTPRSIRDPMESPMSMVTQRMNP